MPFEGEKKSEICIGSTEMQKSETPADDEKIIMEFITIELNSHSGLESEPSTVQSAG